MWYIFPQYDGLRFSSISRHYAIKSAAEAEAYLEHPILGTRLHEYVDAAAYRRNKVRHNDGTSELACAVSDDGFHEMRVTQMQVPVIGFDDGQFIHGSKCSWIKDRESIKFMV
jgi:hypothetical protein